MACLATAALEQLRDAASPAGRAYLSHLTGLLSEGLGTVRMVPKKVLFSAPQLGHGPCTTAPRTDQQGRIKRSGGKVQAGGAARATTRGDGFPARQPDEQTGKGRAAAHLEDEGVLDDNARELGGEEQDDREHDPVRKQRAPRLRQLHARDGAAGSATAPQGKDSRGETLGTLHPNNLLNPFKRSLQALLS